MRSSLAALSTCCLVLVACSAADVEGTDLARGRADDYTEASVEGEEEVVDPVTDGQGIAGSRYQAGVNGGACVESPYNCKLRVKGGNRVETGAGVELWAVGSGRSVRDGDGDPMIASSFEHLRFNFGQKRLLAGKVHVLAMATSNNSAGWFPIDEVRAEASLRERLGDVDAKDPSQGPMACYAIRATHDPGDDLKKVVYDSKSANERASDYMPLLRRNGKPYANLAFNTPGFGLGGVAIDIFPAGTKFQRVQVPTASGRPSIDVPLWAKAPGGGYTRRAGELAFVYGYVRADDGTRRFGWMALPALSPSSGCR